MEEAPSPGEFLWAFSFDAAWIVVLGVAALAYAEAFRRARGGPRQPHPIWKLVSFQGGVLLCALAVLSPLERYGNQVLWLNFLGFLLLTMVAPPLLLFGSPLTLAFRVCGGQKRRYLRSLYRGRVARLLTFPIFTWLAFAGLTYTWQFTRLTDEAAANGVVRDLQQASLLGVALLFWIPALAADPLAWRMPHTLRGLYLFVEMTHKGLFGGMFLSANDAFHAGYSANLPAWAGLSAIDDQRLAILVLWLGGNVIFIGALIGIIIRWVQYERRNAHRTDWRLGLEREALARREAALEQIFSRPL